MPLSRITRRKRLTVLKFVVGGLLASCFLIWIKQVWNISVFPAVETESEPFRQSFVLPKKVNSQKKKDESKSVRPGGYVLAPQRQELADLALKNMFSEMKSVLKHRDDLQLPAVQISAPDKLLKNSLDNFLKRKPPLVRHFTDRYLKVTPGLGENGAPVYLPDEEQALADKEFNTAAFNVYISDRISLNRSVPDPRNPLCKSVQYDHDLPSASVIIIFTNEAWSALLRTIFSVINRTPDHLLHEIILVDDFSDKQFLKHDLKTYIEQYFPSSLIKVIRLNSRQGLIRARLAGAKIATGDVLVFLDSHCETNRQWLEPLLQRIKENRKAVLCPIIDVIDDKTLEYYANNKEYFQIGGFTWSGHFTWIEIPEEEEMRKKSPINPTRSPTMAGGLFAIDRNYFWEIGSYDPGMDIWGGENLEMSFRIWLCGGLLEIVPCSHVGHIFRSFHPYAFPGNKDTHGINTVRTVEVWMGEYKKYFYMYRQDLKQVDYGDISDRIHLKKYLNCKPFSWYLEKIYPQKFIFDKDVSAYGSVRNPISKLCLDTLNRDEDKTEPLGLYHCKAPGDIVMNQLFSLSNNGELRKEENCAEVEDDDTKLWLPVLMTKCHGKKGNQEWMHNMGGQLIHVESGKCLDTATRTSNEEVYATHCDRSHTQIWWFETYTGLQLNVTNKNNEKW